jgi:very-short-patch-repair endonuclease
MVRVRVMRGKSLKSFSRSLRQKQTEAERIIWNCLRSKRFQGLKFRRQQPIGPYIADFCCLEEKLVVELDGGQHVKNADKDAVRTKLLEDEGFRVIRIWDNEVFDNIDGVLEHIRQQIRKPPSPQPSPLKGEGDRKAK